LASAGKICGMKNYFSFFFTKKEEKRKLFVGGHGNWHHRMAKCQKGITGAVAAAAAAAETSSCKERGRI